MKNARKSSPEARHAFNPRVSSTLQGANLQKHEFNTGTTSSLPSDRETDPSLIFS